MRWYLLELPFEWNFFQAMRSHEVSVGLIRAASGGSDAIVTRCGVRLSVESAYRLAELAANAAIDVAVIVPCLRERNGQVCLPVPLPGGGWLRLPNLDPPRAFTPIFLECVATAFMYFRHQPLESSGIRSLVDRKDGESWDVLLQGLRRRGYRMLSTSEVVVSLLHLEQASPTAASFEADDSDERQTRLERLNVDLRRAGVERRRQKVRSSLSGGDYIGGRLVGPARLLVDARGIQASHNGTAHLAIQLIDRLLPLHADTDVWVGADAIEFHALEERWLHRLVTEPDWAGRYDHAVRLNQVWRPEEFRALHALAATISVFMLDTIARDCLSIGGDIDATWELVSTGADHVFFISEYARSRFFQDFPTIDGDQSSIVYLSLRPREYRSVSSQTDLGKVLVIGNRYEHKDVNWAASLLTSAFPELEVLTTLTDGVEGQLPAKELQSMYFSAKAVVFPSHYEGFGIPVLEGAALPREVIARRTVVNEELLAAAPRLPVKLFDTSLELVDLVEGVLANPSLGPTAAFGGQHDWASAAQGVVAGIQRSFGSGGDARWLLRERLLDTERWVDAL